MRNSNDRGMPLNTSGTLVKALTMETMTVAVPASSGVMFPFALRLAAAAASLALLAIPLIPLATRKPTLPNERCARVPLSRRAPHLPCERDAAQADQEPVDHPDGARQHGQPAREPDGKDESRPARQASAPADGHGEREGPDGESELTEQENDGHRPAVGERDDRRQSRRPRQMKPAHDRHGVRLHAEGGQHQGHPGQAPYEATKRERLRRRARVKAVEGEKTEL